MGNPTTKQNCPNHRSPVLVPSFLPFGLAALRSHCWTNWIEMSTSPNDSVRLFFTYSLVSIYEYSLNILPFSFIAHFCVLIGKMSKLAFCQHISWRNSIPGWQINPRIFVDIFCRKCANIMAGSDTFGCLTFESVAPSANILRAQFGFFTSHSTYFFWLCASWNIHLS